jgi:hypothetical protein
LVLGALPLSRFLRQGGDFDFLTSMPMVENNAGGTDTQIVYGPTGTKVATANAGALLKAFVALPGGASAIYNSSGLAYFRHSDWLGSSRLTSTATRPTSMYSSTAYAPFGESQAGQTSGAVDASFTGQGRNGTDGSDPISCHLLDCPPILRRLRAFGRE